MTECYRMKNGYKHNTNSSELSVETSCDMSDSFNIFSDNLSPIPASINLNQFSQAIVPRRLYFSGREDEDEMKDACTAPISISPPYKGVRSLR